ncbi:MAG: hypothetical protein H6838_10965 [Planctomycetes bacterium]|nr:hypothetical protein [Planctomycetota bacterium]MCB9886007.1 hypothetical protein [Planctomycetota bacterium]
MRSPAWIAALLLHATLLAQAPLDLPALGKSIDPGDCPEVYAKIPANYREAAAEAFGDATPASLRLALERAEPESNAWILAAVAILARSDDEPRPPAALVDEILSCDRCAQLWHRENVLQTLRSRETDAAINDEPAQTRRLALLAKLLQQHGDSLEAATEALHWRETRTALSDDDLERLIDRLGPDAGATQHLRLAEEWLRRAQPERAQRALANAQQWWQTHRDRIDAHDQEAALQFGNRLRRLAAIPEPPAGEEGAARQRLRRLQLIDPEAALAHARQWIDAGAADALPFAVAASEVWRRGQPQQALALLDRAKTLPGKDALYATLMFVLRLSPILADKEIDADVKAVVSRQLQDYDKAIADDDSIEASFFRWLRDNLAFSEPWAESAMRDLLPEALVLRDQQPDVPQFARLVFAAASGSRDRAAARKALLAPLPEPLRGLAGLQLERAAALLSFAATDDSTILSDALEAAIADALAAGADPRDGAYLQGVALWMQAVQATAPDRIRTLGRQARAKFVAARKQPGEPGHARTEHALWVMAAAAGQVPDGAGWRIFCQRDGSPTRQRSPAPFLALLGQMSPDDPDLRQAIDEALQSEPYACARVTLATALASICAKKRDSEGAHRASLRALQALEGALFRIPAPGSGVNRNAEFRYALATQLAAAHIVVTFHDELWIIPKLPDLTKLRAWADK